MDEAIRKLKEETGTDDIYRALASKIFNRPANTITKEERDHAKRNLYLWCYGNSGAGSKT